MNNIEFMVSGKYALFTDPKYKIGGEKTTYMIPTYEAIKGVCKSIYWKPTFVWVVDEVRIMNPIKTETMSVRPLSDGFADFKHINNRKNDLAYYTYLKNVRYQVKAHLEWNNNREDLILDRKLSKHINIMNKMIERGGRQDIFLGTRECQAYVEPHTFGHGESFYDGTGVCKEDEMYHSITYADEAYDSKTEGRITKNFWMPVIENGIIKFCRPNRCDRKEYLHEMSIKPFGVEHKNFTIEKE